MHASSIYKAQKGLIKITAELDGDTIKSIQITGDFFMYPEEALLRLEKELKGKRLDRADLDSALEKFYSTGIDTPLITKEDFINAILGVKDAGKTT